MGFFAPNIRALADVRNITGLRRCLDHRRAGVRYSAFAALAGISELDDGTVDAMKRMVHDPDQWVKTIAILKFAEMGDASAESLMEIIEEGTREARIELLQIIAGRGVTGDEGIMQVVMNALVDKKEIVRRQAIITAVATGNRRLMPYLAGRLQEKHHELRIRAAKALFDLGGNGSVDYLIGLLADSHPEVRETARLCLEDVELEYVRKALHDDRFMQLVRGMNGKEPIRRKTAQRIGDAGIREGLALLHRACGDTYKGVRIEALKSIAVFKEPASIEFVERLVRDKYRDVRLEAARTLAGIADPRALKALEGALHDRDKQVREAAQRAVDMMKKSLQ